MFLLQKLCKNCIIFLGEIMNALQGIFLEEIERLQRNILNYKEMLVSLPRGSIFVRKMGNSFFVYRRRKENGKVVSESLGNIDDFKAKEQIQLSNEYKRIKNNIRVASQELAKLKKAYKAYE